MPAVAKSGCCFSAFDRYVPLGKPEFGLYDSVREGIPIVDAALSKLVSLSGGLKVTCADERAQEGLEDFLSRVPVGDCMNGIEAFIAQYLDGLLMYGTAVAEIVPSADFDTVAALYCCPLQSIELLRKKRAAESTLRRSAAPNSKKVKYPELFTVSVLGPKAGELCGNSLLRSLPFVAGVLTKIYETEKVNFERMGNLRFAVT